MPSPTPATTGSSRGAGGEKYCIIYGVEQRWEGAATLLTEEAFVTFDLNSPATYLQWGVIVISLPNLAVIVAMIIVFVLAVLLPLPGRTTKEETDREPDS